MRKLHYFGILVSAAVLVSCSGNSNQGQQAGMAPMSLPVIEIPLRDVSGYTSYPTSIEGTINSQVRAKVSGYITDVLVDEGQPVKKGQTLFKLETQTLSQDAGAAEANVAAAQVEVNRLKPLVAKGIIGKVQLETAEARLVQAQASFNSIAASIDYANIKSPVNGYVGAIPYRQGALVSPNDPSPLTTVSMIDDVYAYFALNERDYLNFIQTTEGANLSEKIKNFPEVELRMVNGSVYEEKGKIETVTGQVSTSTGTVNFRARFPNPNRLLANGNSGSIMIPKTFEQAVVVPESASFEQQGKVYVYKVQGDSVAVSSIIEVADRVEGLIVVASGVEAGEKIVAQGVGSLRNNTPIAPNFVAFDSIANTINVAFK
jgi:membrane fusion protein (multidrug efflux system)